MLDHPYRIFELFLGFLFIISLIMMGISILIIFVMIVRDNRYYQIEEININENNNDDLNNYNDDPLISEEDNCPISVLDKNSEKKFEYKYDSNVINSPSTGPYGLNGSKIKNVNGNEYIELNTNENEYNEKNLIGRLHSENNSRKDIKKSIEI